MNTNRRLSRGAVGLLLCFAAGGCSQILGNDCPDAAGYGLLITVVDARTQQLPASTPSIVVSEGSSYSEQIPSPNAPPVPGRFVAALERTGLYSVRVTAPGYADWHRNGVLVRRAGDCEDIQTVELRAELQPLP